MIQPREINQSSLVLSPLETAFSQIHHIKGAMLNQFMWPFV